MKWELKSLDEIGFIGRGKSRHRPRNAEHLYGGEYPFVQTGDVKAANFKITEFSQTYNEAGLAQSKLWKEGTLCITIAANIADTAILGIDACFPDSVIGFVPYEDKSDVRFVKYFFDIFQARMKSIAVGAAQDNLSLEKLLTFKIPTPSLPTQRKIASILSAYDDLIENNLKRIKLLEEKAQLHYIQYKPIEKIALQDIADYLGRGVTPKYEEGSGFYAINQKANKGSLLEYSQFKSLDSKLEVPDDKFAKWGDLLINSLGEGTLGRVHFYTDKSDLYAVDQHMSIFRTQKQHYTFYLYQFLSSNYGQGLLDSLKKGGTNMTMLNISDLRQLIVSFPSEKELIELWNVCKPLFQLKQTLITQNTKLREARDILLPKLMNGQIEV